MEEMMNELRELKELVHKELKKLTLKGELTPAEVENATKAVCLLEKIQKLEGGDYYDDEGYSEYGGYYPWSHGMSYARSRNPMTGRYTRSGSSYDMERSGHSVKDRMISRLESMMDDAKTEYERQMVMDEISRLRNN